MNLCLKLDYEYLYFQKKYLTSVFGCGTILQQQPRPRGLESLFFNNFLEWSKGMTVLKCLVRAIGGYLRNSVENMV